jgi:hypothetical protein
MSGETSQHLSHAVLEDREPVEEEVSTVRRENDDVAGGSA